MLAVNGDGHLVNASCHFNVLQVEGCDGSHKLSMHGAGGDWRVRAMKYYARRGFQRAGVLAHDSLKGHEELASKPAHRRDGAAFLYGVYTWRLRGEDAVDAPALRVTTP